MDTARCKRGRDRALTLAAVRSLVVMGSLALASAAAAETWRGLEVAPEHRCSAYNKKADYPYPQSVEDDIVRQLGAVYGLYTGTCFTSKRQTDIEHIVAASEAHDSGLCAADRATRTRFAQDLRNLTLASPKVNRHQKSGKDAGEWLPDRNRCWFAGRVLDVKLAYGLTVDRREAATLDRILSRCRSTAIEPLVCQTGPASSGDATRAPTAGDDVLARYDDNRNGGSHARRRTGMESRPSLARIPLTGTCETATGTAWSASKQAKPKKRLPRRPAPGLPSSPPSRGPRCKPSPRSDPPREAQGNRRHQNREPASES